MFGVAYVHMYDLLDNIPSLDHRSRKVDPMNRACATRK